MQPIRNKMVGQICLISILVMSSFGSPRLQGLFNTGMYSFTRSGANDSTLFHTRLHQSLSLNARDLALKDSQLRISGIFYMDPLNSFSNEPGFHIYRLSYQTKWFDRQLSIDLGRQFIYSITATKRIDGIQTVWNRSALSLKIFAGGYLPGLGTTYSPIADHLLGADLLWKFKPGFNLGVGVSELGRDRTTYEVIGLRNGDISVTSSARQRLGYQFNWHTKRFSTYFRARNDLFSLELQDLRARVSYRGDRIRSFSLEYLHREPQVLENSIFSVFDGYASQQIRSQLSISINSDLIAHFRIKHIQFESNRSDQLSAALGYKMIRLDLRHQQGYGGEYNHIIISTNLAMGQSRVYGKLNLGNFKLLEGESQDLATALLGLHIPIGRQFQLKLEGQALRNIYYQYDSRLYLGLRYRL
ncbi:MAG: hypothetical protein L3J79_06090 [Candidatus Marinimicrobia bacterium]|nr:hypothetical protein [Candidatus Neomarinimicrobiota bacterium]